MDRVVAREGDDPAGAVGPALTAVPDAGGGATTFRSLFTTLFAANASVLALIVLSIYLVVRLAARRIRVTSSISTLVCSSVQPR